MISELQRVGRTEATWSYVMSRARSLLHPRNIRYAVRGRL